MSTRKRTPKNLIGIESRGGLLRYNFPRSWSKKLFGVPQKRIASGLSDTPDGWEKAKKLAERMTLDYEDNCFDKSLVRYGLAKPKAQQNLSSSSSEKVLQIRNELRHLLRGYKHLPSEKKLKNYPHQLTVLELWLYYCEKFKKPLIQSTTYHREYLGTFARFFKKANTENPDDIYAWVTTYRDPQSAKEFFSALEKCVDWGIQRKISPYGQDNPFRGLSKTLKRPPLGAKKPPAALIAQPDSEFDKLKSRRSFTLEDQRTIIQAWSESEFSYYTPVIKFQFDTGARPGETADIRWKHIKSDFSEILFCQAYDHSLKITKPTKTYEKRSFPVVDPQLIALLQALKPENAHPDDLVFVSPTGGHVNMQRISTIWGTGYRNRPGIVVQLANEGKIKQYLKFYATRHTFITLQIRIGGVSPEAVAQWVGNSPATIYKYYCDPPQEVKPFIL
jgi:integrase